VGSWRRSASDLDGYYSWCWHRQREHGSRHRPAELQGIPVGGEQSITCQGRWTCRLVAAMWRLIACCPAPVGPPVTSSSRTFRGALSRSGRWISR